MAMFEWRVTSLTSGETTLYESDSGAIFYAATAATGLFGIAGMWVRLPAFAPAIEDIYTAAVAVVGANKGLYAKRSTSTGGTGGISNDHVVSALQVDYFEKGGRWIHLNRTGTALPAKMAVGSAVKHLVLYYTGKGERKGVSIP